MKNLQINILQLKNGEMKPYSDRVYEYQIQVFGTLLGNINEAMLNYCTNCLHRCQSTYNERENFYDNYYDFEIIRDGKNTKLYRYKVTIPYLD